MKSMKFGTKLIFGFLSVAVILLIVGLLGYYNIGNIAKNMSSIIESAPLIDGAMEMKLSLESTMKNADEYRGSGSKTERAAIASELKDHAETYYLFADVMVNGGETEEGTFTATKNNELEKIIENAKQQHAYEFMPLMEKLLEAKEYYESSLSGIEQSMQAFDFEGDKITSLSDQVESFILNDIQNKKSSGTDLLSILNDVVPHVDAIMEIKVAIVLGQRLMEEAIKSETLSELSKYEERLEESFKQADLFITAIIEGSDTEEGHIKATTSSKIRSSVKEFDKNHEEFQKAASVMIKLTQDVISNSAKMEELEEELDAKGEQLAKLLGNVEDLARDEIEVVAAGAIRTASRASMQSVIGISVGFILAIFLGIFITRSVTKPLNRVIEGLSEGAAQVSSASGQISSSCQQLAEGSSEQAASLEETSSSLEEMSSMTKQNADHASQANNLTNEVNQVIGKATDSMTELTGSMEEISKASEETSKIIKTIDEIAFQTNLLALNAAVEAARAGEAGAGFAVVADEVRNLAMRAADAAKSTSDLIEDTVKKINGGSELVGKTNEEFTKVAGSSGKVSELIQEINAASNEQASGIEQVNKAVAEMDKVIQQNASNAEENASASEEMNAQAEEMNGFVGNLTALVSGNANGKGNGQDAVVKPKAKTHRLPAVAPGKAIKKIMGHKAKEVNPQQIIPLDDADFKDF